MMQKEKKGTEDHLNLPLEGSVALRPLYQPNEAKTLPNLHPDSKKYLDFIFYSSLSEIQFAALRTILNKTKQKYFIEKKIRNKTV